MLYCNQEKGICRSVLEDDPMWNGRRSMMLSKISTLIFLCVLIGTAVSAPWLMRWFLSLREGLENTESYFLVTIYTGCVPAAVLLISLYRLLCRIEAGQVFIRKNVECLRRISWSCFMGAVICAVSAFYYIPWAFVAVAAAFMGLIVRVVKNVLAQAVALKDENDFTV